MVRELLLPSLQEVLIPEMKWRKVCPASRTLSLQDNIPCIPQVSVDSMDSFFPSRKPPGSGEFRGLVYGYCLQRPGFSSSHFCEKGSSQPAGLQRAVSFSKSIKESQETKQLRGVAGGGHAPFGAGDLTALIAENAVCEEEMLEEAPRSNQELRLWDYRLLKVFFVL